MKEKLFGTFEHPKLEVQPKLLVVEKLRQEKVPYSYDINLQGCVDLLRGEGVPDDAIRNLEIKLANRPLHPLEAGHFVRPITSDRQPRITIYCSRLYKPRSEYDVTTPDYVFKHELGHFVSWFRDPANIGKRVGERLKRDLKSRTVLKDVSRHLVTLGALSAATPLTTNQLILTDLAINTVVGSFLNSGTRHDERPEEIEAMLFAIKYRNEGPTLLTLTKKG